MAGSIRLNTDSDSDSDSAGYDTRSAASASWPLLWAV